MKNNKTKIVPALWIIISICQFAISFLSFKENKITASVIRLLLGITSVILSVQSYHFYLKEDKKQEE